MIPTSILAYAFQLIPPLTTRVWFLLIYLIRQNMKFVFKPFIENVLHKNIEDHNDWWRNLYCYDLKLVIVPVSLRTSTLALTNDLTKRVPPPIKNNNLPPIHNVQCFIRLKISRPLHILFYRGILKILIPEKTFKSTSKEFKTKS